MRIRAIKPKYISIGDIKVILLFSVLFALISWLLMLAKNIMLAYAAETVMIGFFISLTALSLKKTGSVEIFMLLSSLFSFGTTTVGVGGPKKILAFIIVGLIFEALFVFMRFNGIMTDIISSVSISSAVMPFVISIMLSLNLMREMIVSVLNLALTSLLAGFVGSLIAMIFWEKVRNRKYFVRIRCGTH